MRLLAFLVTLTACGAAAPDPPSREMTEQMRVIHARLCLATEPPVTAHSAHHIIWTLLCAPAPTVTE